MKDEIMGDFREKLTLRLGKNFNLKWDIDKKGVVCGWCKLVDSDDIYAIAEIVAGYKGRVMTISPLNTPSDLAQNSSDGPLKNTADDKKPINLVINYHLYFKGVNCTVTITLPDNQRNVNSITPVLKSADWHEREMQELYNITLQGHPNPKRLFLDKNIHFTDHTMIPLSEALNGASTNTLWERIMGSDRKENADEQL